jgi:hypothetical protein
LNQSDPIMAWMDYLENKALKDKCVPRHYLEARRFFANYGRDILQETLEISDHNVASRPSGSTNAKDSMPATTERRVDAKPLPLPRLAANG